MRSTALAVLTLALVACDRTTSRRDADAAESSVAVTPPAPSVRTIELGRHAGTSLRITEPTVEFTSKDTMFLAVIVQNPDADSRLTARWSAADGSVVDSSGQNVERDMGSAMSVTQFRVMRDKGWPAGRYTVDVWMNGALAGSKAFTVSR
jgi:hypothetical protein